jgi:hypothetical protein
LNRGVAKIFGVVAGGRPVRWHVLRNEVFLSARHLNRNTIWAEPTINATMVINAFRSWADCGMNSTSPIS